MAHSAAASRSRFGGGILQSRASSPNDNLYATATTSFSDKDIMHSTPQRHEPMDSQQGLPLHYSQFADTTLGSADMSIELGRGAKHGAQQEQNDLSSDAIFGFGDDNSQYEVTGTPPIRPQVAQRRTEGGLRKEASLRQANQSTRANDAMKRSTSGLKQRAASDNPPRLHTEPEEPFQPTATFTVRGSRFASARHVSTGYAGFPTRFTTSGGLETAERKPVQPAVGNATVQSATYTANQSFMLPDMPNITELVSGVRINGTPASRRTSRFTAVPSKRQTQAHLPVDAVPIPEDEKAIWASLTLLRDRVAQLEMESSEKEKRAEEYEAQISQLRAQLETASRRSDSALGSDEEDTQHKSRRDEQTRLRVKVKTLQDKLDRTERKINISEITIARVTRERDALIAQIGSAYFNNESLAEENEALHERTEDLQAENDDMKAAFEKVEEENTMLRRRLGEGRSTAPSGKSKISRRNSTAGGKSRMTGEAQKSEDELFKFESVGSKAETDARSTGKARSRSRSQDPSGQTSTNRIEQDSNQDVATRIEREVQKLRAQTVAQSQAPRQSRHQATRSASLRARSRSQNRKSGVRNDHAALRRHVSAPAEIDNDETESTTELDATRKSQHTSRKRHEQSRATATGAEEADLTALSDIDPNAIAQLRRKLEQERRETRLHRQSLGAVRSEENHNARSNVRHSLPRKSSLKDLTGDVDGGTGRFSVHAGVVDDIVKAAKTVRVQSPHSSHDLLQPEGAENEAADDSILSNISRRRRRSAGSEGMTSAFIIPDITLHNTQSLLENIGKNCILHNAASCSECTPDSKPIDIPAPVPVTDRTDNDLTNATIRPAQDPSDALATVIKHLEDEIVHLKLQRDKQNQRYNQHDPALGKRRRQQVKSNIDKLTAQIEKRSDQVYRLYDVLEGQKQAAEKGTGKAMDEQEVEDTLTSLGVDPAELSGRVGRKAPIGLDDDGLGSDSDELPWEGLSDVESDEEGR